MKRMRKGLVWKEWDKGWYEKNEKRVVLYIYLQWGEQDLSRQVLSRTTKEALEVCLIWETLQQDNWQ